MLNYISAVSVHENREFFPSAQWKKNCNDVLIIFIFESQAGVWPFAILEPCRIEARIWANL